MRGNRESPEEIRSTDQTATRRTRSNSNYVLSALILLVTLFALQGAIAAAIRRSLLNGEFDGTLNRSAFLAIPIVAVLGCLAGFLFRPRRFHVWLGGAAGVIVGLLLSVTYLTQSGEFDSLLRVQAVSAAVIMGLAIFLRLWSENF